MSESPELSLLGNASSFPASPDDAKLEAFPNRTPGRDYTIKLETHEFSSLCPVTGQPDSAQIKIVYIPNQYCVETKSLKYYLSSYRNFPSFNEAIVNRILDDIVTAIQPKWMQVEGQFAPRGGIQLTTTAEHNAHNRPK